MWFCATLIELVSAQVKPPVPTLGTDPSIELGVVEDSTPHPITLKDIVSTRELLEPQISPDGKVIAFIVTQAFLDQNENRSALFVVGTEADSQPVKILQEKSLSQIRWSPDGEYITYLSGMSGDSQIWRVSPKSKRPELLFQHDSGISRYDWSSDGKKIAFITASPLSSQERAEMEAQGIVYDNAFRDLRDLINKRWEKKKPKQLWVYYLQERKAQKLWEHDSIIADITWSPDGQKIATEYQVTRDIEDDRNIGIVSLRGGNIEPVLTWEGWEIKASWSPDGKSIAFLSEGDIKGKRRNYARNIFVFNLENKKIAQLTPPNRGLGKPWWSKDGNHIFFELENWNNSAIYEVPSFGGLSTKLSQGSDHLSEISLDKDRGRVACIWQNLTTPPEVALINIKDGIPKTLTTLNRGYKNIKLGEVSEIKWTNKYGNETNGFLIKPINYEEGKRYPLLIILYAFSRKFTSQAQWITTYPAQAFAANGYVVLMMNYPFRQGWYYGNYEQGIFDLAYNPLASIEKAVETVVEMRIADPGRKGIMGWSYGGFLTNFTITHTNLFEAASSGEGGTTDPGIYWLGRVVQYLYDGIFGGPPLGEWYEKYNKISPALNAANVHNPVMLQHASDTIGTLEFYTALKTQGKSVELLFYPNESHIFFQPKHRFYAMQQNLDWFNYWLLGKEDPDPAKRLQYIRWNDMKGAERKSNHR